MNFLSQTPPAFDPPIGELGKAALVNPFETAALAVTPAPSLPLPMVQPFGCLMAFHPAQKTGRSRANWTITQLSENCANVLGLGALPEVGSEMAALFTSAAMERLDKGLSRLTQPLSVERIFGLALIDDGGLFDCAIYRSNGGVICEFEPHDAASFENHAAVVTPILSQLSNITDCDALCDQMSQIVRDLLGYDRAMVCQFHANNRLKVIAESVRDDLDPVLGLEFERDNIAQFASTSFARSRLRIVADTTAQPVPVVPAVGDDGIKLDLALSTLRANLPVDAERLQEADPRATLDIAIVRQGQLWGMISCHHYEPRLLPSSLRTIAEMFSQMFSLLLDRVLIDNAERLQSRGRALHDQLMLRLASGGSSLAGSLPMVSEILSEAIAHDGVSVLIEGDYNGVGSAPDQARFEALLPRYLAHTAALSFEHKASGALVLPISRHPRDYLVIWRRRDNPPAPWSQDDLTLAEGLRVTLLEVVLRMTDEIARERKRSQEQQELLIAELNHRVRNILNLIRSLVSQSQDDAQSVSSFANIISGRITALSNAHDNITRENWAPAALSALFETELAAYVGEKMNRFTFEGDEVLIKPEAYTVLALVVHELVTNSAKYGALCDGHGQLHVRADRHAGGDLSFHWREIGGPAVRAPARRGFGSTIIERSIPFELSGEAKMMFKLTGLEAQFRVPARYIEQLSPTDGGAQTPQPSQNQSARRQAAPGLRGDIASPDGLPADLLPAHVLVVEDSMIIAIDTEENLKRLGVKSVQVESNVKGALKSIQQHAPDFAIVDYNLGNESSAPVAEALRLRGIRFVLATGYAEGESQFEALGASALLRKPYGRDDIKAILLPEECVSA